MNLVSLETNSVNSDAWELSSNHSLELGTRGNKAARLNYKFECIYTVDFGFNKWAA